MHCGYRVEDTRKDRNLWRTVAALRRMNPFIPVCDTKGSIFEQHMGARSSRRTEDRRELTRPMRPALGIDCAPLDFWNQVKPGFMSGISRQAIDLG